MSDQTHELAEIENLETSIETLPEAGGLLNTNKANAEDIFWLADNIEKIISSQNKIRIAILKLAQPGDWIVFESKEAGTKKAELGFAGANRIGATLGISYKNWNHEKKVQRDDAGEWYLHEFTCDAVFRNTEIRVYGRAGSRDKFFGKAHGVVKQIHEIKEDDIKVAAMRAAKKEGVRDLLGLHHLDPDFLTKNGVVLSGAGGHSFKGKEATAAGTESVTVSIEKVLVKTGVNKATGKAWTKYTIVDAEAAGYATFSKTIAEAAKKAQESKAPAKIDFTRDQWGLNISSFNGITSGGDQ